MGYSGVREAVEALRSGLPIMVFDSEAREAEVDLIYHASSVTWEEIYDLRMNAGGLICFATHGRIAKALGLPWGDELYSKHPVLRPLAQRRLGYGDRTAFTVWVNHKDVATGIRDEDRARTVRRLADVARLVWEDKVEEARRIFKEEFVAPGHVPILASRGLKERRGHTELAVSIAVLAGTTPALVIAEMLDRGSQLSLEKARDLARRRGIPLVSGDEVLAACREREVCWRG